ncbi:MAG: haloacid dehalogenase-like hydrolase [Thermoplasmata archaeon]|nr:haloacid dehalogenase-like hydrolase [Thermoplasmata archaeon]
MSIDIDGTLTRVHGWEYLAASTGKLHRFEVANRRYLAGGVTEDQHLTELVDLATGLSESEVDRALAATPRLSGIREAIALLHEREVVVALLTHNPPYVCEWYAKQFGFDDYEGTQGSSISRGVVTAPHGIHADKVVGMGRLLERHGIHPQAALHAGDGPPDAAVFPTVGGGVALNSKWPRVRALADATLDADDLRELVTVIDRLPSRPIR